jgi:hypothetical protein
MDYMVIAEDTCPACRGVGWLRNPEWASVDELFDTNVDRELAAGKSRGQAVEVAAQAVAAHWVGQGYKQPPPQEICCAECEGNGYLRREVSLAQALSSLGLRMRLEGTLQADAGQKELGL